MRLIGVEVVVTMARSGRISCKLCVSAAASTWSCQVVSRDLRISSLSGNEDTCRSSSLVGSAPASATYQCPVNSPKNTYSS